MDMSKRNFREISVEEFINIVFILVTISILSSVFWSSEPDVLGYYQNLIIASFSVALTVLHIYREILDKKSQGYILPRGIFPLYVIGILLVACCCAVPICLLTMTNRNNYLFEHIQKNKYSKLCYLSFIPIMISIILGYIYPLFGLSYTYPGIRLEERNK